VLFLITLLYRKSVEELLERLFSSCDIALGAEYLRQLCVGEVVDVQPMHPCLQFVSGDCGGVKVVVTDDNRLVTCFVCNHSKLIYIILFPYFHVISQLFIDIFIAHL